MTHHLGSSLVPQMLEVTFAWPDSGVAVALRLEIVLALWHVYLTQALLKSVLTDDDVPLGR